MQAAQRESLLEAAVTDCGRQFNVLSYMLRAPAVGIDLAPLDLSDRVQSVS